jgi:prepilin signal peptidase PulO-like enzyme (type II secretory pathway)
VGYSIRVEIHILLIFFVLVFGSIIGSFLNVVIMRYNTGQSIMGRSSCATCVRRLTWYELIPIVSYLLLSGRCRTCGSLVHIQYPLVELSTGLLFLGIFLMEVHPLEQLFLAIVVSILVVIFVYDVNHKIVPNLYVYTFSGLAFLKLFINLGTLTFEIPLYSELLAGPLLFTPFFLLWLISRGRWIGLGDGKLALGIGWMLGLTAGITAILLAFWMGAIIGVLLLILPKVLQHIRLFPSLKGYTMKSEVPFAPFLILGFLIPLFLGVDIVFWNNTILNFLS